jgi:hypothetical protein
MHAQSVIHYRMHAMECRQLAGCAAAEAEAALLREMAKCWVRLANQTDRYFALVRERSFKEQQG